MKKVEYAKKLPGKWKVTRLFNDAYNRMESGLAMTITFKADGTYYAALTYTSPAVKPGVKMTFGVKGVWTVEKGGDILLDDKERYINPQVTYSGGDPHVRYWCNNIAKMTNSEFFYIVSGAANNPLVGGTAIFSHQSGNLLTGVKINGNKLTCNYWTARAYDCVMTKIQ